MLDLDLSVPLLCAVQKVKQTLKQVVIDLILLLNLPFSLSPYPETTVGLDPSSFTVSESDEVIEICITAVGVNTPCPSSVPFEISLSTLSHTTGMYYTWNA